MDMQIDAQHKLDPERLRPVLPNAPGVYLFKDSSGRVIYVGKAKNLKKRVFSYLKSSADLPYKTAMLMNKACSLDFILTSTEKEAFILESNLIKKYAPRYNVILKDDKQYPCLRLNLTEPFPRLSISRKIKKDGGAYFGPFSSAHSVRSTHKVIDRVFQLRKCKGRGLKKRTRPCLNYQIGRCLGPCTFEVSLPVYAEIVQKVRLFLEGRNQELISKLKEEMGEASRRLDFERAAKIRDQIEAVKKTVERQNVVSKRLEDQDIIGLAQDEKQCRLVILFVRKGYLVGNRNYLFNDPKGSASEVMEAFLKQYYSRNAFIPKQILISESVKDLGLITEWLSDLEGNKVRVHRPLKGEKLQLLKMALANAKNLLDSSAEQETQSLMSMVQSVLRLKTTPEFIEGMDISNLYGDNPVGAVVSFVDGLPNRSAYRNYRINTVGNIDDYGMMSELVEKRVSKGSLPDLFLVDGGKGHLAVVNKGLDRHINGDVPEVVSIAKPDKNRGEECDKIFIMGRKNPLSLKSDHPVLLLMMRIRDEAHRRAVTYHRRLRGKDTMRSELDLIAGIGPKRKAFLLRHYKSIDAISKAGVDDLERVSGINRSLAENIFSFFQGCKG